MSELIGGTSVQLQSSPLAQDVTKQTQVQFSEHWLSFKKLYKPHLAALRKKHFLCTVIQPPHLRVVWGHQNNCPGCDNCTFVKVTINRSETCEMHTCTNCSRKQLCKIIAQVVFLWQLLWLQVKNLWMGCLRKQVYNSDNNCYLLWKCTNVHF